MKKIIILIVLILAVTTACSGITPEAAPEINAAASLPVTPPMPSPLPTPTPTPSPSPTPSPTPEPPPKLIALTFDDGPSVHTAAILDTLEKHNAHATFFVVGNRVAAYPSTVRRAYALGNEVANHSHSHPRLTLLSDNKVEYEIKSASVAIASVIGTSPPIYRPPFGATDERVVDISRDMGYAIIKWTLDPLDWRDRDPSTIYDRIISQAEDGSVIVLHDIHLTTAQAMERVVPSLIEKGFTLVTVTELLEQRYGGIAAGDIHGFYCAWRIWDN